ncbi:hypothetical protein NA644_20950 [Pseudomonas stutzeri]|uniref:Cthe-2314-like HEPN domain-containing protein n=1 Tax=Stutzerimonas stutzeri TaxID=316 RepID=A0A2N8SQL9_STUST|nr:hypothetical protein [Stutzerimonas stutzeri]MCQ4251780.1 hypothetical protein [Stutzerimonas stutzeri]PNG04759.1 hypothetical protein CXL00_13890 [Stutzerimonas stutzeri]
MRRQMHPEELEILYRYIGKCIWHIQYVEDALHTLLTLKIEIKTPGAVPEDKAYELLKKHRRATLGTALRTAKENNSLPQGLFSRLSNLKEERDWLVHRSQHQDADTLYTDVGRQTVFQRLEALQAEAVSLQPAIAEQIRLFVESHGVNSEKAKQIAEQEIAALTGHV